MKKVVFSGRIFFEFAIFVFFLIELNYDWNQDSILHWGAVALLVMAYLFKDDGVIDLNLRDYSWWMLGILTISLISFLYTNHLGNSISMFKKLAVNFVAFTLIRNYLNNDERIESILNKYILAVLINMIYVINNIDLSLIGKVQLGVNTIVGWNGNLIGIMASSAAVLSVYMFLHSKKVIKKLSYISIMVFLIYIFLYTGSRKSIALFVICLITMLFVKNPRKVIRNTILTVLILYGAYMLVMNNESLYNVLGVRLEGLFAAISGEGEVDRSTLLRQLFIRTGWDCIFNSPIIGYGLDSFRTLNKTITGYYTYSHNNFIEMAINFGLVGFIFYYCAYLTIIKRFFKYLKNNILAVTIFSLFIVTLFMHYGMVAYYDVWQNLLLCIGFAYVNGKKSENTEGEVEDDKETC